MHLCIQWHEMLSNSFQNLIQSRENFLQIKFSIINEQAKNYYCRQKNFIDINDSGYKI